MSEYQYYEFQAIDRALTRAQQEQLAEYSTRAEITSTRFVNHYDWGDFRGDVDSWITKYFDAFVYIASWGTRDLRFRFPREVLDAKVAKAYCAGGGLTVRSAGKQVVLAFWSEDESGDRWDDRRTRLDANVDPSARGHRRGRSPCAVSRLAPLRV